MPNPLASLKAKKPPAKTGPATPKSSGVSISPGDILKWVKFFFTSFRTFNLVKPLLLAKLPPQVQKYASYVIGGLYALIFGTQFVWPVFFGKGYRRFWKAHRDWEWYETAHPILTFLLILPILFGIGLSVWRYFRQKHLAEITGAFKKDRVSMIFRPRGDDKCQWRKSYTSFWAAIHGVFTVSDTDILLQKTPFGSFELNRYSPLISGYPGMVLGALISKNQAAKVINQIRSLHNDIVIERPEKDHLERMQKDSPDSKVMYVDYAPVGPATGLLDVDVDSHDLFREIATVLTDVPTGVQAAGFHLLVRDTLNMYDLLATEVQTMQYDQQGKRKPLDKSGRDTVEKLERKKIDMRSKNSYDIVVRIYVVGNKEDEAQATLEALTEWASRLSGANSMRAINKGEDWETLIERRFPEKNGTLSCISPMELMPIWHIPDVTDRVDGIERAGFRMLPPAGATIIREGDAARLVGYYPTSNGERLTIGIRSRGRNPDVFYHVYVVGPTGVGKSVQLLNHIVSDMNTINEVNGLPFSVIVIEPHEDLTADVLKRVPDEREKDVVILDPLDPWPFGLNMMETTGDPDRVDADAMNVMAAFRKASGASWETAVRMRKLLNDAVQTTMRVLPRRGVMPTVMHLQSFMSNGVYRQDVIDGLTADDGGLINNWMAFLSKSEAQQNTEFESSLNRLNDFINNPIMRRIIAQPYLSLDWKELMDGGAIVLCKMNNDMGGQNKALLGSLITSSIFKTAMSRRKQDITQRHPTGFYIDEFQTFVSAGGDELKAILAEARKMRLSLTMANQYFNQLPPDVQDAVGNNTGTKIVFRVKQQDAALFVKLFGGKLTQDDFMGLNKYMAHCTLMAKEDIYPVTVFTFPEPPVPPDKDAVAIDRDLHRDSAARMGVKLVQCKGQPANAMEALGHVLSLATVPAPDRETHTAVKSFLENLPDAMFGDFQKLRKQWAAVQRELLLANPGYIPQKRARVEQLSRLRVGVPAWEVDAMIGRLFNSMREMMKSRDEASRGDDFFSDDLMPTSGGASPSAGRGGGKATKGNVNMDDLFDSF